jgi:hypothetical protein
MPPIQVRKFQNNRRCSLNIENEIGKNIGICPPSCGGPLGEATDYGLQATGLEQRGPLLANLDIYGEKEAKKNAS